MQQCLKFRVIRFQLCKMTKINKNNRVKNKKRNKNNNYNWKQIFCKSFLLKFQDYLHWELAKLLLIHHLLQISWLIKTKVYFNKPVLFK
jgi:hypothetical protein